jgi:hypothetical protein
MVPTSAIPDLMSDTQVSQAVFVRLLKAAMAWSELTQTEIVRRTKGAISLKHFNQRTLNPEYHPGPPKEHVREALERAMGVPKGYLNGEVPLPTRRATGEIPVRPAYSPLPAEKPDPGAVGRPPESLFREPTIPMDDKEWNENQRAYMDALKYVDDAAAAGVLDRTTEKMLRFYFREVAYGAERDLARAKVAPPANGEHAS